MQPKIGLALGADVVIAIDVWPIFGKDRTGAPSEYKLFRLPFVPDSIMEMWRIVMIAIGETSALKLRETKPDVLIKPNLPVYIDLLIGFENAAEAIAAGEAAAEAALPQIRGLLDVAAPLVSRPLFGLYLQVAGDLYDRVYGSVV